MSIFSRGNTQSSRTVSVTLPAQEQNLSLELGPHNLINIVFHNGCNAVFLGELKETVLNIQDLQGLIPNGPENAMLDTKQMYEKSLGHRVRHLSLKYPHYDRSLARLGALMNQVKIEHVEILGKDSLAIDGLLYVPDRKIYFSVIRTIEAPLGPPESQLLENVS